jgi:hypothetical protein
MHGSHFLARCSRLIHEGPPPLHPWAHVLALQHLQDLAPPFPSVCQTFFSAAGETHVRLVKLKPESELNEARYVGIGTLACCSLLDISVTVYCTRFKDAKRELLDDCSNGWPIRCLKHLQTRSSEYYQCVILAC